MVADDEDGQGRQGPSGLKYPVIFGKRDDTRGEIRALLGGTGGNNRRVRICV